jgi:AraC family transcriptional regulator of adaptative response / DNA-3-methyladenine glycosylase II
MESVVDGAYRRTIALNGEPGPLEPGPGGADHLLLRAHLLIWEGVVHVWWSAARPSGADFDPSAARPGIRCRARRRPPAPAGDRRPRSSS